MGCGDDDLVTDNTPRATALFSENAGKDSATFFDAPYPSDTRLTPRGTPEVSQWPTGAVPSMLTTAIQGAGERPGFPVVPVGYFRFDAEPPTRDPALLEDRGYGGAFALIDVDPSSPERGKTFPVVGTHPAADSYTPEHLFAVAARPGIVLHPKRTYAFVLMRRLGGEANMVLERSSTLSELARGETPARGDGEQLRALYTPLWETLRQRDVDPDEVVAATVFTTGDVVEQTAQISDKVLAKYTGQLSELTLEEPPAEGFPSFCHYTGSFTAPQFQQGKPPFQSRGLFEFDADGAPVVQREESVNFSITIPRTPMPAAGYPLVIYFHGSGGVAREFVDGAEKNEPGQLQAWPGRVLADKGFAVAGTSLPISPDRVPGAASFDYLNINNPGAMLGTFRQGVIEQRLLLRVLAMLRIPKAQIDACEGASLPAGVDAASLDLSRLAAQGQSMGGMYTNLVSAVEPQIQAAVPTGAGGYWMFFFLETTTVKGNDVLQIFLRSPGYRFSFMNPVLHLYETALEPIDPMISMPRLARRPLEGHPVRPIYEPVGLDDSYFPPKVYDAMVLAYGHPRAGDEVWTSMREAQSLIGLDQPVSYPVKQNLSAADGTPYTGVAVQYKATGDWDSHGIFRRLEEVRHQYGCFHATFQKNGVGVVPAPGPESTPCPE